MKQHRLLWLAIIWLLILGVGCGRRDEPSGASDDGGEGGGEIASPVDAATAATISGKVLFTGTAPEAEVIRMDAEIACKEKYSEGPFTEGVVVNDNGALQNVFIYVKEGLGDLKFPVPQEAALLDQEGCRYKPHVLGLQTGQELTIRNSDGLLHNIHPMPTENRSFNLGQPKNMDSTKKFPKAELAIPIKCDVHDWMIGYLHVLDHPYFATTGSDGSFELSNLPPGDYVIEAWHEEYGTQTMNVTVGDSESADIEFTFAGS